MSRARSGLRDRWRAEVLRTKLVPDGCRVLLLVLAEHMSDAGYTSIRQSELAEILDVHPRRVSERVTQAKRANLLQQRGGYSGRTSEYIAVLPGRKVAEFRPPNSVHLSAHEKWANRTGMGAEKRPPNTRVTYETRTTDVVSRDLCGSPDTNSPKPGRDEGVAACSALAADSLSRWSA